MYSGDFVQHDQTANLASSNGVYKLNLNPASGVGFNATLSGRYSLALSHQGSVTTSREDQFVMTFGSPTSADHCVLLGTGYFGAIQATTRSSQLHPVTCITTFVL